MPTIKGRIVFLDYMRIFAFLSVLIGHKFAENIGPLSVDPSLHITIRYFAEMLNPFYLGGAAGVVVFFLISGYIITHVLQTEKPADFLIKRIFRIYPLFIAAVLLEEFLRFVVSGAQLSPLSVFIPRVLLIGDFFDLPHALAGVEWTLRIEIMFYLLMAGMKASGAFRTSNWLPLMLLAMAMILYFLPEIPGTTLWNHGYFNLYTPFLFMGACIYLAETGMAKRYTCIAATFLMFFSFLLLIAKIHPGWKETHYAIIALLLFLSTFLIRHRMKEVPTITFVANITYSVYLFHNYLWDYLMLAIQKFNFSLIPIKAQVLIILLIFCYLTHRIVEQYGIKLGKRAVSYYRKWIDTEKLYGQHNFRVSSST